MIRKILYSNLDTIQVILPNLSTLFSSKKRTHLRAELQDLYMHLILTKEQKEMRRKILRGDCSDLDQFHGDFEALKAPKAVGQVIWDSVLSYLEQENALEDLRIDEKLAKTFENVVEAMLFHRSAVSLSSDTIYAKQKELLIGLLAHLIKGTELAKYPTLQDLVTKAHSRLTDPDEADAIKKLIQDLASTS